MLKQLNLFLKTLGLFGLFTLVMTSFIIMLFLHSNLPQKYAKKLALNYINDQIQIPFTFQKLSGDIYSQLTIEQIKCFETEKKHAPIFEIENIHMQYNPLKLLLHKGNILKAADSIVVNNMTYNIWRNHDGKFINIKPKNASNNTNLNLNFNGKIIVNNLTLDYQDKKGWKKTALSLPFKDQVSSLYGTIDFKNDKKGVIQLKGKINESNQPFSISGHIIPEKASYFIAFETPQLNISHWGPYVIPATGYTLNQGQASINGYIRNQAYSNNTKNPLWYDLDITVTNSEMKSPFFEQSITSLNGKIKLTKGELSSAVLDAKQLYLTEKNKKNILSQAQSFKIISDKTQLNTSAKTKLNRLQSTLTKKEFEVLNDLITHPAPTIQFLSTQGILSNIPATLHGSFQLKDKWLELAIKTSSFESKNILSILPGLKELDPSNKIDLTCNIFGKTNHLTLKGSIQSDTLRLKTIPFSNVDVHYILKKDHLHLDIKKSSIQEGLMLGKLDIHELYDSPHLKGTLFMSQLSINPFLENENISTGNIDLSATINGPLSNLSGTIQGLANNLEVYNQTIDNFQGNFNFSKNHLELTNITCYLNNSISPILITANISENTISTIWDTKSLPIHDPFELNKNHIPGLVDTHGQVRIHLNHLKEYPAQAIYSSLSLNAKNMFLFKNPYDTISMKLSHEKNITTLDLFHATHSQGEIITSGLFINKKIANQSLNIKNTDIEKIPFLDLVIPEKITPLSGILSCNISINTLKNNLVATGSIRVDQLNIQNIALESMIASGKYTNNQLHFETLSFNKQQSTLLLSGTLSESFETNLHINPLSRLDIKEFSSLVDSELDLNGILKCEGHLKGTYPNITLTSTLQSELLTIDKIPITNMSIASIWSPKSIYIDQASLKINEGSIHINGTSNKTKNNYKNMIFSTTFSSVDVEDIKHIFENTSSLFKPKSNTSMKRSQYTYSIKTPFSENDILPLYNKNTSSSIGNFIRSIKQNMIKKDDTLKNNFILKKGILSGTLTIDTLSQNSPLLKGNVLIKNGRAPFLKSQETSIEFIPKLSQTIFKIKGKNGTLNKNNFKTFDFQGIISKDNTLHINKTELELEDKTLKNIVEGTLTLPLNDTPKTNYPIDLRLNLSKDNLTILSNFSKNMETISHKSNLMIRITGDMRNPVIETNQQELSDVVINLNNPSHASIIKLQKASFSLIDNHLKLKNWIFNRYKTEDKKEIWVDSFELNGDFKVSALSLLDPDITIINTSINSDSQSFYTNNNYLKGMIDLKSFNLNGDIVIPITKKTKQEIASIYKDNQLQTPFIKSNLKLENSTIFITKTKSQSTQPYDIDTQINIGENVFLSGSLFGNTLLGVSADLEFSPTQTPLLIKGNKDQLNYNNSMVIQEGSLQLLNREFEVIPIIQQQLYTKEKNLDTFTNEIKLENQINIEGEESFSPQISLKAVTIIENEVSTDNIINPYTHVVLSINDHLMNLNKIHFDVFESEKENPNSSSDLTYIRRYTLTNETISNEDTIEAETAELIKILVPGLFDENIANSDLINQIGETQFNALIRRSVLRPFEKKLAKQIGVSDLKFDYNLGKQLFEKTDDQKLGLQIIQNLISDQLVLRLKTNMDLSNDDENTTNDPLELSEIELTYYVLKNKNLSLNLSNYKDNDDSSESYTSKLSMRYKYEY